MADTPTPEQVEAYRQEILKRIEAHVQETEYVLNPNEKAVEALVGGLIRRKVEHGNYYCPCRVVTGDPAQDAANVCPCETHEAEIAASGKCHCALFFAADAV